MDQDQTNDDQLQTVTLWFPKRWKDHSDVEWNLDGDVLWGFRQVPRVGEHLHWQDSHHFEVVSVMRQANDYAEESIHVRLDVATDADREHLHALGGLCLRDQLILARACGASWDELGQDYEILPSALLRYVRDQKELADRDLVTEVVEGGDYGVDISGLDRAAVLAALWNGCRPSSQDRDELLTVEEAKSVLTDRGGRIGSLRGRTLQVVLTGDRFNPWLYDQAAFNADLDDLGHVTAERVVTHLRATGSIDGAL
ncbi:hypothetical protein ACH4TP_38085 [Streptomyces sp. NPDC021012]|uniref:hypothetical protein n=1 Tax=Streptomyces sp. NPDC021012 TaxID=3365107 RepID=UPI00378CC0EF